MLAPQSLALDVPATRRIRLLSYNIQVGISSTSPHHYLTQMWQHVLPHRRRFANLDRIGQLLGDYDIVGLQEVDAGSHRTAFVNLTEYLAKRADFPFWYHQLNRDLGKLAQHSNGLLSRFRPTEIVEHKLPGLIPGRGALMVRFGNGQGALIVMLIHLALSPRARVRQLEYVSDVVNEHDHVVLMGDMNCGPESREMDILFRRTRLREPLEELCTFPSWRPNRNIDHILVTPGIDVAQCHVINHAFSDHLPIAMEVVLPETVQLPA